MRNISRKWSAVLNAVKQDANFKDFRQPVGVQWPNIDYRAVRHSTSFQTIDEKLNAGELETDQEFVDELRTIWCNCFCFNFENNTFRNLALELADRCRGLFEKQQLPEPTEITVSEVLHPGGLQLTIINSKQLMYGLKNPGQKNSSKRKDTKSPPPSASRPKRAKRETASPAPKASTSATGRRTPSTKTPKPKPKPPKRPSRPAKTPPPLPPAPTLPPAVKTILESDAGFLSPTGMVACQEKLEALDLLVNFDLDKVEKASEKSEKEDIKNSLIEYLNLLRELRGTVDELSAGQ